MYQDKYYADKNTNTFADVFLAYGLATLLESVLFHFVPDGCWVKILDQAQYYEIRLSHDLREEWVRKASFQALAPYIKKTPDDKGAPIALSPSMVIDLKAERERSEQYFRTISEKHVKTSSELVAKNKPHPYLRIFYLINDLKAITTYNSLIIRWQDISAHYAETLSHILMLYSEPMVEAETVKKAWQTRMNEIGIDIKSDATLLQLFNPSQGKGQNESKANRLNMTNLSAFWLPEYLKAVGMYHCAIPRMVKTNGKYSGDRKTYALSPMNISLAVSEGVLAAFRDALWDDTAVKMDILSLLKYANCYLEFCEEARKDEIDIFEHGPEEFVSGLFATYYKNLGKAAAVMNLSFLELPNWLSIRAQADIKKYEEVIHEHETVIQGIDEEKGGYNLLVSYRDFISGGNWKSFYNFITGYSALLIQGIAKQQRWMKPFTTRNLEVLIVNSNRLLTPILETQGFQNIAAAIRNSTIIPQYRGRDKSEYEVRYGLAQELKRKSMYNDNFVAAVGEFVQSYNSENARVYEKTDKHFRKNIKTSDLDDIVRLVDQYGASTIANLLIAFGYAKEAKEEDNQKEEGGQDD